MKRIMSFKKYLSALY